MLVEDDLGFVPGDVEDTDALAAAVRRARVYAGHAGWGPGQLEDELAEEAWIVEAPLREELFSDEPEGSVGRGPAPHGARVRAPLDDAAGPSLN